MTYTLELENKEDFAKVKKFLEQIKGAKITDNEDDLPDDIMESLHNYALSVKEEDCISEEEFFAKSRKKICELYSRK